MASERIPYADDDAIRNALQLAKRLPATGRKPSEYLLASALRELDARHVELQMTVRNFVVANARQPADEDELERVARQLVEVVIPPIADAAVAS